MYEKLKKPILVDFDDSIMRPCALRYYDDGSENKGDSGYKCRSEFGRKDEPYCSQHDCPLCRCPTLEDIKNHDEYYYPGTVNLIVSDGENIEDYEGKQPKKLPCEVGSNLVIQYYEVIK